MVASIFQADYPDFKCKGRVACSKIELEIIVWKGRYFDPLWYVEELRA